MATFRLNPLHPMTQKIDKLFALMDELKINIEYRYDKYVIIDTVSGESYIIKEIDGENSNELPPLFDYKVIIEKY